MKRLLIYMLTGASLMGTSCSDFLDTIPRDALSPSTTWQTEEDAQKFLVGCYDGWVDDSAISIGIVALISAIIILYMKVGDL